MSKMPTEFEVQDLMFELRTAKNHETAISKKVICRDLDINPKYFPKLLKMARRMADAKYLNIMNTGNDAYYVAKQKGVPH